MKTKCPFPLISVVTLLSTAVARAWWADGHMLIAAIAYQELTDSEKAQVDSILAQHSKIGDWIADNPSKLESFMRSSIWPDQIRNYNDPTTHPNWHFIDYPLKPNKFRMKPDLHPADNAVVGITQLRVSLEDTHTSAPEQARDLSFLIHFVGDIHQPLHCESLFDSTFNNPDGEGDRGGTRFYVLTSATSQHGTQLHSFWDGRLGSGSKSNLTALATIEAKVPGLKAAHPRSDFTAELAKPDPKDWSLESRLFAINKGYKPLPSLDGTTNHPVQLPASYAQDAKDLSERQAVLAGYRLADTLKAVLAANPPP